MFIEVTYDGVKTLINTDTIQMIQSQRSCKDADRGRRYCLITFKDTLDTIIIAENYDEVKVLLRAVEKYK